MAGTTVNFKNHCVLCLQPENPLKMLDILQTNPLKLESFQPVVHYLTGTDPTHDLSAQICQEKDLPVMRNLPTLCVRCYNLSAEIYGLHKSLLEFEGLIQGKVDQARKIVLGAGKGRQVRMGNDTDNRRQVERIPSFWELLMELGMSPEEVATTNEFKNRFHGQILEQGTDKFNFN